MYKTYKVESMDEIIAKLKEKESKRYSPTNTKQAVKNDTSKDVRFSLGGNALSKLNRLERETKISKSQILSIAIQKLIDKHKNMRKKDFLSCINKEYMKYLIDYSKTDIKSKRLMLKAINNIMLNGSIK